MSSKGCKLKGGSPPNVGLSGSEGCRMQRFVHLQLRLGGISFFLIFLNLFFGLWCVDIKFFFLNYFLQV